MTIVEIRFTVNPAYENNPYAYDERAEELLVNITNVVQRIVDLGFDQHGFTLTETHRHGTKVQFNDHDDALMFKLAYVHDPR